MSADATGSLIWTKRQHPRCAYACEAYMEGIHVGFDRRICTDASSKPLPITTYCLRTFHRLGTNPTGKTALHLPWSDFRASFGAEDAGIQEYSKDDKPEITGNRPCQAARIPFMYAPVFSPCSSFVILLFFALLLDDYPYRRTLKAVGVSEAVFDISLIREVEQLGAVAENHKRRRLYSRLGHIIQL